MAQRRNSGRSAAGTPSSAQITPTGRGYANAAMKSTGPSAASIASTSSSACARTTSRMAAIRRGVNAPAASRRIRLWSGGLVRSIDREIDSTAGLSRQPGMNWSRSASSITPNRASRRIASASA